MNQLTKYLMQGVVVTAAALLFIGNSSRAAAGEDQSLARGAIEDRTPQQKYQTAIREAGGAYKGSLRDCAMTAGEDRRSCAREAKITYDRDMAEARMIIRGQEPRQVISRQ